MSPKKRKMRTRERQALGGLGLLGDEMINIVLDGLQRSPYFHNLEPTVVMDHKAEPDFVLKEPEDVIWVVDSRNLTLPSYHYSVDEEVLIAAKATVRYQETLKGNKKPSLKVVFVDYHDKNNLRTAMCSPEREALIKLLGVGNVRHVVGKVVTGESGTQINSGRSEEPYGKTRITSALENLPFALHIRFDLTTWTPFNTSILNSSAHMPLTRKEARRPLSARFATLM